MDDLIASAKKEVLVEMVKLAQKREMAGSKGHWKEFLKFFDKKLGDSLSDPSRRPAETLAAFLKTFEEDGDVKFFTKVLQCHSNRDEVEQLKKISPEDVTAEQRLVQLTLEHPQYPIDYAFPSHEEEWLVVKPKKKARKSVEMIAIDCEMVLCEDGTEALVRVCAVDRNLQVKLDMVVNPNKVIADYRTEITGISAKDLEGVTFSLKDVQKSMKRLLSRGAILVGHSLNNDLQALRLDHARVVDTSYIFKFANGLTNRKPSLSLLCKTMLGYELRKKGHPHNCMDDACAAMKLVLAKLEGQTGDIVAEEVKELDIAKSDTTNLDTAKLLIHRIPINVPNKDLKNVLSGDFTIEVKVSKNTRQTYSAFAIFKNQQEAIEAFQNLEGDLEKDSCGRPQKIVKFELDSGIKGTLCICNTVSVGQVTKKRPAEDDACAVEKKPKTEQIEDSNQCDTHLKEIERLKEEISQRDTEIASLNKLIAALVRKQGL